MMSLRWRRRLIVMLWLIFLPPAAICQQLPLRYYSQSDGLTNMAVNALAQEPGGYLWIGTQNGLFRYDGARFQRFELRQGLPTPFVSTLHVDGSGRLWVGTSEGLYLWQGQRFVSMQFQNVQFKFYQGQTFATLGPHRLLVISGDRLWLVQSRDQGHSWQAHEFSRRDNYRFIPRCKHFSVSMSARTEICGWDASARCAITNKGSCRYWGRKAVCPQAKIGAPFFMIGKTCSGCVAITRCLYCRLAAMSSRTVRQTRTGSRRRMEFHFWPQTPPAGFLAGTTKASSAGTASAGNPSASPAD
ncbi:ligand-binding sensor domain-containing protein [Collimonas arenae]|uniref:ligand-binding sensor domain-containing protein n=1 Tax=Collimonas arenae TaxID=279058 RepID=UPI001F2A66C8|nr:two-component regulator propeller domain-containing protein [Collimonas arenae]